MNTNSNNDPNNEKTVLSDLIIPSLLLIASYGILFFMPRGESKLSYVILAVSAFLFCLGFFALGGLLSDLISESILTKVLIIFAFVLLTFGFVFLYFDEGSMRSIIVATLFLIQSIMIFAMSTGEPGSERIVSVIFKIISVALIAIGIFLMIREKLEHGSIETAAFMLITSIVLWSFGGNNYNETNTQSKTVPEIKNIPLEDLCRNFEDTETPLGHAWIGKVQGRDKCIIFGPAQDGTFVYCFYQFGRFYVAAIQKEHWLDADEAEKHRIELSPDKAEILENRSYLPELYRSMFATCAKKMNESSM